MRQYRCIRKYDHFLPILCTYVRCISKLAEIGRMVGGLIKANPGIRKSPNE